MEELDFLSVSEEEIEREKQKARDLRRSQWWKNRRASGRCHYCGRQFPVHELTMDHVVPLARGGRSVKANVEPCCKACNSQKNILLPLEWEAYLAGFGAEGTGEAPAGGLTEPD